MRKLLCFAATLFALSLSSAPAWAWGCSGHEIVALIARQELQQLDRQHGTQVLPEVERLLALQDRNYPHRFCSDLHLDPVAFWATWADDHRSLEPATGSWHYWDIPLSQTSPATLPQYCAEGCVVQALQQQIAILRDKTRSDAERSMALLWVLHLVGDMHQPLHEVDNSDRGGNCVPVSLPHHAAERRTNGGYNPNLHGIWDTELVELAGEIDRKSPDAAAEVSAFAERLDHENAKIIHRFERGPIDPVHWANEVHSQTSDLPYAHLQPPIKAVPAGASAASCENTAVMYFGRYETVDASYVGLGRHEVSMMLSFAGARLADVLYNSLR
jgi:hypothetical protein